MNRLIWRKLGLIALLLALPFVVFFGSSGRTLVNGRVVSEYSVNYAGMALAVIGLVLAVRVVLQRSLSERTDAPPTPPWVRAAGAALAVLAAAQLAFQAGLVTL